MNEHSLIYMTKLYDEAMELNTKLQEELENLKNTNEEHRILNGKLREEKDKEIERLKEELKYTIPIVEHNKTITKHLKEIERLNNIINTILEFDFFKNNCPLDFSYTEKSNEDEAQNVFYEDAYCEENCSNEFKKCWLKYFEELQELKGSEK